MKKLILTIINFFKKLFGIKNDNEEVTTPMPTIITDIKESGSTQNNEDTCVDIEIIPSNSSGNGGEKTFKINKHNKC